MMTAPLVSVQDLEVDYRSGERTTRALDVASLTIAPGESVGLVGESGSGKTTLGLMLGRLLPTVAHCVGGSITVDGHDVLGLDARGLRTLRGETLGFIPQDPIASLDPTMRIGRQLALALGGSASRDDLVARLEQVQISDPARVLRLYPHQVSGGMAQRIAIALAMSCSPRLLIADEPTAALDSQVRSDVLKLVFGLAAEAGTAILWLSHDLNAVSRWCDRIAVMYGGRVVEDGDSTQVLDRPGHPYTAALAAADPARAKAGERLVAIGGAPPVLHGASPGCAFAPRCSFTTDVCSATRPEPVFVGEGQVLCHHARELAATSTGARAPERPGVAS